MTWRLVTVGKPALGYARAGCEEYLARIGHFARVERVVVKAADPARESDAMLDRSEGCWRVVLDGLGRALTSRQLAEKVEMWTQSSRPTALLIGGANGHDASLRDDADFVWSLGPLTLQHELALVVAVEQIYRAHTIIAGHPYHRE